MNMTMYELLGKLFPTMKPLDSDKKPEKPETAVGESSNACSVETVSEAEVQEKIDFAKVESEPLFRDFVDYETCSK